MTQGLIPPEQIGPVNGKGLPGNISELSTPSNYPPLREVLKKRFPSDVPLSTPPSPHQEPGPLPNPKTSNLTGKPF